MKNSIAPSFFAAIILTSLLVSCTKDVPVVDRHSYANSNNTSTVAMTKTKTPLPIGPLDTVVVKTTP